MQRNTARMWSLDALLNPTQSALTSLVAALPTWATLQTQMSFNTLAILPCYSAFCGLWLYPNFPARDEATMVRCRYAFRPSLVCLHGTAEMSVAKARNIRLHAVSSNTKIHNKRGTTQPPDPLAMQQHSPPSPRRQKRPGRMRIFFGRVETLAAGRARLW